MSGVRREATTLAQLCADLGPRLLDVAVAPAGVDVEIADIAFHDALDRREEGALAGHLLLAVGVATEVAELEAAVRGAGEVSAAAVAVRGTAEGAARAAAQGLARGSAEGLARGAAEGAARAADLPPRVLAAAEEAGVAVLTIMPGVAWGDLFELLRASVAAERGADPAGLGRAGLGDLFALADATASLAGGPVTIEDPQSRVLAFSGGQGIDQGRMATILDRRVPEHWMRQLRQRGILDRLLTSEDVLRVSLEGTEPRRAIAIRAGGAMLGSIWLAGADDALGDHADDALQRAAKVAAVHLLRQRTTDDLERRLRGRALAALLRGDGPAEFALRQVGLPGEGGLVVLAIAVEGAEAGERLVDLVTMHLQAYRRHAVATLDGPRVYVLAGARGGDDRAALRQIAADSLERARHALGVELRAGLGDHVATAEQVPDSRRSAERALELGGGGGAGGGRVVLSEAVHGRALLADVETFVAGWSATLSPELRALIDHDRTHGTDYVRTLRAYLDALGSGTLAARRLHVHVNTVRYRMRRVGEITGVDLTRGDARLALELELRGLGPGAGLDRQSEP
jgi:hypothetical protein